MQQRFLFNETFPEKKFISFKPVKMNERIKTAASKTFEVFK